MAQLDLLADLRLAQEWVEPLLAELIDEATPDPTLRDCCLYAVSQMGLRERSWLVATSASLSGCDRQIFSPFALSAECFIAAALTSDDVLDGADSRWGKPTCLARWGSREAMLIAEHLHALAHLTLDRAFSIRSGLKPHGLQAAVREYREHYGEFFSWQFTDIRSEGRTEFSLDEVTALAFRRTGRLLYACLLAAPRAQGLGARQLAALEAYGRGIGTLLQLRDDVLDFLGEPDELGKPIFGDLVNGQPNLVLHFALASPSRQAREELLPLLACRRTLTREEQVKTLQLLREGGALQAAQRFMFSQADSAELALQSLPAGDDRERLRLFLGALVDLPYEPSQWQ